MASTRILVTGGAGFVGSHTCKALASHGLRPIVFDNLSRGHRDLVKWGDFVAGNVRNRAEVRAALEHHKVDAVMHFAALAYVGESVNSPLEYYDVNVAGTHSVLSAMQRNRCPNNSAIEQLRHLRNAGPYTDQRDSAATAHQSLWPFQAHGRDCFSPTVLLPTVFALHRCDISMPRALTPTVSSANATILRLISSRWRSWQRQVALALSEFSVTTIPRPTALVSATMCTLPILPKAMCGRWRSSMPGRTASPSTWARAVATA